MELSLLSTKSKTCSTLVCLLTLYAGLYLVDGTTNVTTAAPSSAINGVQQTGVDTSPSPSGGVQVKAAQPDSYEWKPVSIDVLISNKALSGLYTINTAFLGAVQPRIITEIQHLFDFSDPGKTGQNLRDNWQEVAKYFLGFAICAGLGVFLLLCVPLSGLFISCCRCCGKCGGKVHPRDKSSSDCGRCCCGFLLFACMAFVLTGGVLMVIVSTDINKQLTGTESVFDITSQNLAKIGEYTKNSVDDLKSATLVPYKKTNVEVFSQLDNILTEVKANFNASASLDDLKKFGDSLPDMKINAQAVKGNASDYNSERNSLSTSLESTRTNVNPTLTSCMDQACIDAKTALDALALVADFSSVNLDAFIAVVDEAVQKDISGAVNTGLNKYNQVFEDANQTLSTETENAKTKSKEVEDSIQKLLNDVETQLNSTILTDLSTTILDTKKNLAVDNVYLRIPFWSMLGLGALVLVLALCYYFGLSYGFCGSRAEENHSGGCCSWKTGACWLVSGLALTYIFYFFLMLVLLVTFLAGGGLYTEVCRHAYNLPESDARQFFDKVIQTYVPDNISFTLSETYRDCSNNQSLYVALKLEQNGVNLSSIISTDDINNAVKAIKDVNVTISSITFLNQDVEGALKALGEEIDKVSVNVKTWIEEAAKEVINGSMTQVASLLDAAADNTSDANAVRTAATDLRGYETQVQELESIKATLSTHLNALHILTSQNVTAIVEGLKSIESLLNNNGSMIVKTVITDTADNVNGTVSATADAIINSVKTDVGRCYPVYDGLSGIINSGCVQTLYPINAYAFSLGMVLIFLLPVILCAFKLVTLYRKTKPYRAIEDHDDRDLYMAYQDGPYTAKDNHNDMLLHRVDRPKSDYIAMADNPVFLDDNQMVPVQIPRAVIRTGTRVLPVSQVQPAAPDDSYFYAMPARGAGAPLPHHSGVQQYPHTNEPPPRYTLSPTGRPHYTARSQV